jgi:hypothetical protein
MQEYRHNYLYYLMERIWLSIIYKLESV